MISDLKNSKLPYFLFICASLFFASSVHCQENSVYYEKSDGSLHLLPPNENVEESAVSEWVIKLYGPGQSTNNSWGWGEISAKTKEEVLRSLKSSQEFQVRFANCCGPGPKKDYRKDAHTYFNPKGPIARLKRTRSTRERSVSQKLTLAFSRLKELKEGYGKLTDLYDGITNQNQNKEIIPNKFKNIGSVLREYTTNLRDADLLLSKLQKELNSIGSINFDFIVSSLNDIEKDFGKISKAEKAVGTIFDFQMPSDEGWKDRIVNNSNPILKARQTIEISGKILIVNKYGINNSTNNENQSPNGEYTNPKWRLSIPFSSLLPDGKISKPDPSINFWSIEWAPKDGSPSGTSRNYYVSGFKEWPANGLGLSFDDSTDAKNAKEAIELYINNSGVSPAR